MDHQKDDATPRNPAPSHLSSFDEPLPRRAYQSPRFDAQPLAVLVQSGGSGVRDKGGFKFP